LGDFKFRGQAQRKTAVIDVHGAVTLILLLPGSHAAGVRRQAAQLLVRWLGGDLSLIDEEPEYIKLFYLAVFRIASLQTIPVCGPVAEWHSIGYKIPLSSKQILM